MSTVRLGAPFAKGMPDWQRRRHRLIIEGAIDLAIFDHRFFKRFDGSNRMFFENISVEAAQIITTREHLFFFFHSSISAMSCWRAPSC